MKFSELIIKKSIDKYFEAQCRRKDGNLFWSSIISIPHTTPDGKIQIITILQDITERKKLESQFLQSQKMEAVGRLIGGIAHDFNNVLTTIMGYSELLLHELSQGDSSFKKINIIRETAERAFQLTSRLLTFSKKHFVEPVILNLNDLIVDMEKILKRILGEDIKCQFILQPDLRSIKADKIQIEQVILNLSANAREAMPQGGELIISTENVYLEEKYLSFHPAQKPGEYVMISVSDTGIGMSSDVKEHIFEPFFTTKEEGTGLGLSTVYGIVTQYGGFISVYSEPGKGTTFKIYFPSLVEEKESLKKASYHPEMKMPAGSETILVVEDQKDVLKLITDVLENLGYSVISSSDTDDAILKAKVHKGKIDLLISDVILPDKKGPELAEEIKLIHSQIKVLFISGYANNRISLSEISEGKAYFLSKPFTPSALARKVREVLDIPVKNT